MSYVNLVIVYNEKVYHTSVHYRFAQFLVDKPSLAKRFVEDLEGYYLDAGFIVIDYDNDEILNRQDAFYSEKF